VKFVVWILSVETGMERLIIVYEKLCVQMNAPFCNPIDSVKFIPHDEFTQLSDMHDMYRKKQQLLQLY
jgi:hypothetical protein